MLPRKVYSALLILYQLFTTLRANVVDVTENNLNQLLASNDLVLLNFYVHQCKYSRQLEPVFNNVAKLIKVKYPEDNIVVLGRVNCEKEKALAKRYAITKYPTVSVVQYGVTQWSEYRGPRSIEGLIKFLESNLQDPVVELQANKHLDRMMIKNALVVGYFKSKSDEQHFAYRQAVRHLGTFGQFFVGLGNVADEVYQDGRNGLVAYRNNGYFTEYTGNMSDVFQMRTWIAYQCQPIVQEITFANAEKMTDTNRPLLLLFHMKNDYDSVRDYRKAVESEPNTGSEHRMAANFLTASYDMFSDVVHHMGKTESDLPFIAFDSFQHMYVFPKFQDIYVPGKIQEFIDDLYSGKLHYLYHANRTADPSGRRPPTTRVPSSKFKFLRPSAFRYTFARDEL